MEGQFWYGGMVRGPWLMRVPLMRSCRWQVAIFSLEESGPENTCRRRLSIQSRSSHAVLSNLLILVYTARLILTLLIASSFVKLQRMMTSVLVLGWLGHPFIFNIDCVFTCCRKTCSSICHCQYSSAILKWHKISESLPLLCSTCESFTVALLLNSVTFPLIKNPQINVDLTYLIYFSVHYYDIMIIITLLPLQRCMQTSAWPGPLVLML